MTGDLKLKELDPSNVKYYDAWGNKVGLSGGIWYGDNKTHRIICPDNYIVTGIEIYATNYFDDYMKLQCTGLKTGYTTEESGYGNPDAYGPGIGSDNQDHVVQCPAGQYIKGMSIESSTYLDGNIQLYCTAIIP